MQRFNWLPLRTTIASGLVLAALAACSDGDGGGDIALPPPPPPAPPASLQSGFGAGFAAAFDTGRLGNPSDPAAGDVIAITKTADPVAVP